MNIQQQKKQLRRQVLQLRQTLPANYVQSSNRQIAAHVLNHPLYKQAGTLFCFVSTPGEVDTHPILQDAWARGKRVCVPLCTAPGSMWACPVSSIGQLQPGTRGILEPDKNSAHPIDVSLIDFAIVPCLSTDLSGNRLGYGGGYYDRFLHNAPFTSAVLCRARLISPHIPTQPWDIPIKQVITEKGIYQAGHKVDFPSANTGL